jgi:hypothetical protein
MFDPAAARNTTAPMPDQTSCTSSQRTDRSAPRRSNGDRSALDRLVPLVHAELRRLARRYMAGERSGQTLQTTALVNELPVPGRCEQRSLVESREFLRDCRRKSCAEYASTTPAAAASASAAVGPLRQPRRGADGPRNRAPGLEVLDGARGTLARVDERLARSSCGSSGGLAVRDGGGAPRLHGRRASRLAPSQGLAPAGAS